MRNLQLDCPLFSDYANICSASRRDFQNGLEGEIPPQFSLPAASHRQKDAHLTLLGFSLQILPLRKRDRERQRGDISKVLRNEEETGWEETKRIFFPPPPPPIRPSCFVPRRKEGRKNTKGIPASLHLVRREHKNRAGCDPQILFSSRKEDVRPN